MKLKSIGPIVGLFLLLVTIASLVPPVAQAQQDAILRWSRFDVPGPQGNIIVTPSEVSKFAVGRGTITYAIDNANGRMYRSENAGLTWTDITPNLISSGVPVPDQDSNIACVSDRPAVVALVTTNGTRVYVSMDYGANWMNTQVPAITGTIQCIAISRAYDYNEFTGLVWDMAIGTAVWGNNTTTGQVWTYRIGGIASSWSNQNITIDPAHIGAEVSAIVFQSASTMVVVASTSDADVAAAYQQRTWLCIGFRDTAAQTTNWNLPAAGYPVKIEVTPPALPADGNGDAPGVTRIVSSLALPSDFSGNNARTRKAFLSYDRQPNARNANDDVYRVNDITVARLNAAGGVNINISSIAYYGAGAGSTCAADIPADAKLLAGDADPVPASFYTQVRRCGNPFDLSPTWKEATLLPTGPGNAQVKWSPDGNIGYCGTGQIPGLPLDESAFSITIDNGDNWYQVSLIDTNINISDVLPAPDSRSVFIATYNPLPLFSTVPKGVWRTAGAPLGMYWWRVLTIANGTTNKLIMRLSPNYSEDYTIYVTEVGPGAYRMAVSHDRGNSWQRRSTPIAPSDMVVADQNTAYVAVADGRIRKTTSNGQVWQVPLYTGLADINMLALTQNGHVLVGSRDGRVAYSTDGGTNFIEIPKPIRNRTGDVQVVADANYVRNNLIYAATNNVDDGIWRWTIGASTQWEQIDRVITDLGSGQRISGLKLGSEGTLYALRSEAVAVIGGNRTGGMDRTLNPSDIVVKIEYDILNLTLPLGVSFDPTLLAFPTTLSHLRLSGDSRENVLWSIDTVNDIVYRFVDNICKAGPATAVPPDVGCDPASGRNQAFGLIWEQLSLSDRHELHIGKDNMFTLRLGPVEPFANPFYPPPQLTNPAYYVNPNQALECGHSYFWRVRTRRATTGEIIRSPWSIPKQFIIKAGFRVTRPYYGVQLLAPDNGCSCSVTAPVCFSWSPYKETTSYLFELSESADMDSALVSTVVDGTTAYQYTGRLKSNASYFWRVKANWPAPSEWSAVFNFKTAPPAEPPKTAPVSFAGTPLWIWVVMGIGVILVVVNLILIVRTRRM